MSVGTVVTLSPEDIPGAVLTEPYARHTAATLRWWLLCRGVKVSLLLRKQQPTLVLSFTTSTLISNTTSQSALLSASLGIRWNVTLGSFALLLPQTIQTWPVIFRNTVTPRWTIAIYNLKQTADSWKTLVLRYALKKNIYGNTRASRD